MVKKQGYRCIVWRYMDLRNMIVWDFVQWHLDSWEYGEQLLSYNSGRGAQGRRFQLTPLNLNNV